MHKIRSTPRSFETSKYGFHSSRHRRWSQSKCSREMKVSSARLVAERPGMEKTPPSHRAGMIRGAGRRFRKARNDRNTGRKSQFGDTDHGGPPMNCLLAPKGDGAYSDTRTVAAMRPSWSEEAIGRLAQSFHGQDGGLNTTHHRKHPASPCLAFASGCPHESGAGDSEALD